jgi:hypothetical protein
MAGPHVQLAGRAAMFDVISRADGRPCLSGP